MIHRSHAVGKDRGHWANYKDNMFTTESEKARLRDQADELPRPHPDLQHRACAATATCRCAGRIRFLPPQRAVGCVARHHARARLRAGRRTHILYEDAGPAGNGGVQRPRLQRIYADFGFHDIARQAVHAPGEAHRLRRSAWDKAEAALAEASGRQGAGITNCSPAKARSTARRSSSRSRTAIGRVWQCGTHAGRFRDAAAPRRALRRRGQRAPHSGHAAPGDPRIAGALHRYPHRELMPAHCRSGWSPMQAVVLNISESRATTPGRWQKRLRAAGLRVEAICATKKLPIKYENIA
jgi:threonyl-tRNA synthetase